VAKKHNIRTKYFQLPIIWATRNNDEIDVVYIVLPFDAQRIRDAWRQCRQTRVLRKADGHTSDECQAMIDACKSLKRN
jgi:hypothetical protein